MDIKMYLRGIGITQTELANKLHLSRPTLDSYISQYEKTGKLSKKKYELIFDSLFGDTLLSKDEFIEMISNVGNLISQDEKYDVSELEPEDTDLFMSVLRNMRNDMVHSHSISIYRYINIMISNYHKEKIFRYIADYFLFLNGLVDESDIMEKEKMYLAYLYDAFKNFPTESKPYEYEEVYVKLVNRRNAIIDDNRKRTQAQKEQTNMFVELVQKKIHEMESNGIEVSESMVKDIIASVAKDTF